MRNWFLGLLCGLALAFLVLVAAAFLATTFSTLPPSVEEPTTLVLDLEGRIIEQNATDLAARLTQGKLKPTLRELLENIEKAAADSRVTGMVVRLRSPQLGWAKAEELHTALGRFRKTGKKLYCHMIYAGLREYYLATACEKIYMQPVGLLDVKGIRAEATFWKGTLDKIGAQAEFVHTGEYKTFSNAYTETRMTEAHRDMLNWLVDGLYGQMVQAVAEARQKSLEEARAAIEGGPYEPQEAKKAGLVDQLLYEDQVYDLLKNQDPEKRFHKMSARSYLRVPPEDVGLAAEAKIGLVYGVGTILAGEDNLDPLGGGRSMGAETMARVLHEAGEDDSLKAVVFRVDSPGGDALASDTIWRALMNLRKKKPVVFSMSDVAASGGYYIAATGDAIVANRATITASIGVVYGKVNLRGLYDKLGITKDMVSRGPYARLDSEYRSYTPEERRRVEKLTEDMYQEFLRKVSAARNIKLEDMDAVARGRVFTGEQAKEKGLVDELGGLERAVELAKEKAGIAPSERVELVPLPPPRSLFEILLERSQSARVRLFRLELPPQPESLRALLALRLFRSDRPLALMPFHLEFR
jgi:protease-4